MNEVCYAIKGCKPKEHNWKLLMKDFDLFQCKKCGFIMSKDKIDKLKVDVNGN